MDEIEVKILEIDKRAVVEKLESFGADKLFDADLEQLYFDFADKRLSQDYKILRLRSEGDYSELTYKEDSGKSNDAKIMDEVEVEVEDFNSMKKILEFIGFKNWLSLKKHRTSFSIGDVHFEIDEFKDIPPLLEIEASSEELVFEWVEKLGFDRSDAKAWSGKDVMDHYSGS